MIIIKNRPPKEMLSFPKSRYNGAQTVTFDDFNDTEECHCGKKLFQYHDSARNIHVKKCSVRTEEYHLKCNTFKQNNKKKCDFFIMYHHIERPVLAEINKALTRTINKAVDPHKQLEQKLTNLFTFLLLANRDVTLQEIDILVEKQLLRKPRIVYYIPCIPQLVVSHKESINDYRNRIFSEKIINRSLLGSSIIPTPTIKNKNIENNENNGNYHPVVLHAMKRIKQQQEKQIIINTTKTKVPSKKKKVAKKPEPIIMFDDSESEKDSDSDSGSVSDSDNENKNDSESSLESDSDDDPESDVKETESESDESETSDTSEIIVDDIDDIVDDDDYSDNYSDYD